MRKTGILGGTFDPIHIGHLVLAESARDMAELDEIRFLPSGHSYFKDHRGDPVSSPEDRLRMCELAVADNPYFTVSDMEIRRAGNSYTFETMEALRDAEPDTRFFFICGADSLLQMRSWRCPERLFASCGILAAARQGEFSMEALRREREALRREFQADITLLSMRGMQISSTELREDVRKGYSVRYRVPEPVIDYMKAHRLYHG